MTLPKDLKFNLAVTPMIVGTFEPVLKDLEKRLNKNYEKRIAENTGKCFWVLRRLAVT